MSPNPQRIGICGLGLIGGSIARRLVATDDVSVVGCDRDQEVSREAEAIGVQIAPDLEVLAADSELVVIATPPRATADLMLTAASANPEAIVIDVTSAKSSISASLEASADTSRILMTHPMAGSEQSGFGASAERLLDECTWALCPHEPEPDIEALEQVGWLLDLFSAKAVCCSPQEHDQAVALTSHAAHLVATAVAGSIEETKHPGLTAALSGGALRDITRVASSSYELWEEILDINRAPTAAVLLRWSELLKDLAESSPSELAEDWRRGELGRARLMSVRWDERSWEKQAIEPTWDALRSLSADGSSFRRPQLEGGDLVVEVLRAQRRDDSEGADERHAHPEPSAQQLEPDSR